MITTPTVGPNDIFHDPTEQDDLDLQRAGEKWLPDLISGRYDEGLAAAVNGSVGQRKNPTFESLFTGYRGPISATEAKASFIPQLLNAAACHFANFVAPRYPPLAVMARIQGKVDLQVTVVPTTGDLPTASVISGHPLLRTHRCRSLQTVALRPGITQLRLDPRDDRLRPSLRSVAHLFAFARAFPFFG
ncbi:MAG: hypothetical protein JWP63_1618 [Candidatus Solibacter sp.]|nr:hypothetical protein [Candidatus Solibacter sp.]